MIATLGLVSICLALGMGLGVALTLFAMHRMGVFKGYDVNDLVSRAKQVDEEIRAGGTD